MSTTVTLDLRATPPEIGPPVSESEITGSVLLRAVLALRAARFVNGQPVPPPLPVTAGAGPERRLLVCGSGIAVGYGVPSERDALQGHLAMLASAEGGSVTVDAVVQPRVGIGAMRYLLAEAQTGAYSGVAWAPSFLDAGHAPSARRINDIDAVLTRLRAVSTGWVAVVGIPAIEGSRRLDAIARRQSDAANALLRERAERVRGTVFVPPPSLSTIRHDNAFDSDYFRRCASDALRAASTLTLAA